jgi:hypothetical protein
MKNFPFRSVIGKLGYIAEVLRFDIQHALRQVSQYQENPGMAHWMALVQILRYLKGTRDYGLVIGAGDQSCNLTAYCDADHGGCLETRKSRSGGVLYIGDTVIKVICKRQTSVALSTMDAELNALRDMGTEVEYFDNLLAELNINRSQPIRVFEDNNSCIDISKNPIGSRSKHLEIKVCYIRDLIERGVIQVLPIDTEIQRADIFTKDLARILFEAHRYAIGIRKLSMHAKKN